MPKQLTTQNASITTVAVEVKALTISGKQVTLSVFRQLREEPVISSDGSLNGVPWGYVNYHPDKCADRAAHWHIVWQRGSDLLRSRVEHKLAPTPWGCDEGDAFLSAHVREVMEGRGRYFSGKLPEINPGAGGLCATLTGEAAFPVIMRCADSLGRPLFALWDLESALDRIGRMPNSFPAGAEAHQRSALASAVDNLSCAPPEPEEVDELHAAYRKKLAEETRRRARHHEVRSALAQLPQLFIAV